MKRSWTILAFIIITIAVAVLTANGAVKNLLMVFDLRLYGTALPITDERDSVEINRPSGIQTIKAGEDRGWVNNSVVDNGNTIILATVLTDDATATSARAVDIVEGSFVIKLNQAATGNVRVGWVVVNIDE